jgi:hypothetical protein
MPQLRYMPHGGLTYDYCNPSPFNDFPLASHVP